MELVTEPLMVPVTEPVMRLVMWFVIEPPMSHLHMMVPLMRSLMGTVYFLIEYLVILLRLVSEFLGHLASH